MHCPRPPPTHRPLAFAAAYPALTQIVGEHRRAMMVVATSLYDLLHHLAELGSAARIAQRAYRAHIGRGFLALSKHQVHT